MEGEFVTPRRQCADYQYNVPSTGIFRTKMSRMFCYDIRRWMRHCAIQFKSTDSRFRLPRLESGSALTICLKFLQLT